MLFSEVYGTYFNVVAAVLREALAGTLDQKRLRALVQAIGFEETGMNIDDALREGRWPFLAGDLHTTLEHVPTMPLTTLQKRWLKTVLQDERVRLFEVDDAGLEDVEPLFRPEQLVYFDRYGDGDDFTDERYISNFRTVLWALEEKRELRIAFRGNRGTSLSWEHFLPARLEYSAKDDKFRLLGRVNGKPATVNMATITFCSAGRRMRGGELPVATRRTETAVLLLTDERNALERALHHFSHLKKETECLDGRNYRLTLEYDAEDRTEMLIRILSFGPLLRVEEPEALREQVIQRLARQRELLAK